MWPLPVSELLFVGRSTEQVLKKLGIYTIGELARTDVEILKYHLKKQGKHLEFCQWQRCFSGGKRCSWE